MQRAQGKMLREYFSGVPVENLSRRYGYAIPKIKQLASICRKSRGRTAQKLKERHPEISLGDPSIYTTMFALIKVSAI